ncbi:MAG: dockerin type I repeat-containing protein [Ruminococcus sp.]
MKIIKKVLASAIGAVMVFSVVGSFSASSVSNSIDPVEIPEGYSEVQGLDCTYSKQTTSTYTGERENMKIYSDDVLSEDFIRLDYCRCNYTVFEVIGSKREVFNDIYSKYSEKLDMDFYRGCIVSENVPDADINVYFYDETDENGKVTTDISKFENKQGLIQEMCEEMYKAECIRTANYKGAVYACTQGYFGGLIITLNKDYEESDYETMQAVLDNYDNARVSWYAEKSCEYRAYCNMSDSKQIISDLKEVFSDTIEVNEYVSLLAYPVEVSSAEVDLLSGLSTAPEILYGDLSLDGRVGIADAVIMNKHINGSVTLNADQQEAADLDANGEVNADDLYVLMQYLVNIIDTLPAAE